MQVGRPFLLQEVLDLVLPRHCAGCGAPATGWCEQCAEQLTPRPGAVAVRTASPDPCPPGLPPVRVAAVYAGVTRSALAAYKDGERRDLAGVLARPLAAAIWSAVLAAPRAGGLVAVPVPCSPTSRRTRGDRPLRALVGRALRLLPAEHSPLLLDALRVSRRVEDQAGLGAAERWANLHCAFEVRPQAAGRLRATEGVIVVDDVLTTGATLAEAQRAVRTCTAAPLALVALAATPRRAPARSPTADAQSCPSQEGWTRFDYIPGAFETPSQRR